jgi:1-acyl-sn-glycerol-3-phosphate acyltransferase
VKGEPVFYWIVKVILSPLLRLLFRPWAEGLENVPDDGPVIIASNHLSFSDSIFMPLVVQRQVTFWAKSDYFTQRGVKGVLKRFFFRATGQLPVDRSGGKAGEAALRGGLAVLAKGDLLGIYPEGTRSPDGRLYRGKTGVARMALEGGALVVPCAMIDTEKINPPGSVIWKLRPRPGMRFGEPLDFSRYAGMSGDRYVLRSVTDEIMYELMLLSGQEYVDTYAATAKRQAARAATGGPPDDDPHDADPVVQDLDDAGVDAALDAAAEQTGDGDPPARRAS